MTVQGLRIVLLVFALVGYAGAGASLAVARFRYLTDGERDAGLLGIAVMLFAFGALCTMAGSGLWGVLAFGGVAVGAAYLLTGQHIGMFRIEAKQGNVPSGHEYPDQARHTR
jgi:hypothetical protein